jgi:DNA-binding SARP family transcriptional activator
VDRPGVIGKSAGSQRGIIPMPQLRLLTFGGLVLVLGERPVTGAVTQRHRLALFALLAAARSQGVSREKLLAYLWPESDVRHARHRLNEVLSAQRRSLGGDALFLGRKTLRLNLEVVSADIWEFLDAIDSHAYDAAVRLYAGPFLDGFFLRKAPEFERWVEGARERLARQCALALAVLAGGATAAGDHRGAMEWWCRASDLHPFDADVAIHLVEACVAAGDRATAVRHAESYQRRLENELGMSPDPGVARLTERLRYGPGG